MWWKSLGNQNYKYTLQRAQFYIDFQENSTSYRTLHYLNCTAQSCSATTQIPKAQVHQIWRDTRRKYRTSDFKVLLINEHKYISYIVLIKFLLSIVFIIKFKYYLGDLLNINLVLYFSRFPHTLNTPRHDTIYLQARR